MKYFYMGEKPLDIKIELFNKSSNSGYVDYFMNVSSPYEDLGQVFWEWMYEEKYIVTLIDGVEKTMRGEWDEDLPLEFGSETAGIDINSEVSYFRNYFNKKEPTPIPTIKILYLLNMWLNYLRFSR